MSDPVLRSVDGRTGIIELARPDKFNCLSEATLNGIDNARAAFEADPAVRAVLVRAQGDNFCTGADLDEVKAAREAEATVDRMIELGQDTLSRLEASPLPVVVAVQGLALAGGLELMMACDVVFAGDGARFGDQHAQFGLIPGFGGSQRLTRLIGLRRALDLFYSARWIDAAEAERFGLVNHVVPDTELWAAAGDYCATLATRSRVGLAEMKRLAREGLDLPLDASMRLERDAAVRHLRGADTAEGLAAFEGRRQPEFGD